MRRARFAVSDGDGINERATVKDALTFDLRTPDTSDDDSLASQRVAMFELAPALLGATHLVWGLACLLLHPAAALNTPATNPIVPVLAVLLLDAAMFFGMWYRDHDYDFLVFTDHNVLPTTERWVDVEKSKGGRKAFDKLKAKFPEWVEERESEGRLEVRLRRFDEVSSKIAVPWTGAAG